MHCFVKIICRYKVLERNKVLSCCWNTILFYCLFAFTILHFFYYCLISTIELVTYWKLFEWNPSLYFLSLAPSAASFCWTRFLSLIQSYANIWHSSLMWNDINCLLLISLNLQKIWAIMWLERTDIATQTQTTTSDRWSVHCLWRCWKC